MKNKNLIFGMILVSVLLMTSLISAGITGYALRNLKLGDSSLDNFGGEIAVGKTATNAEGNQVTVTAVRKSFFRGTRVDVEVIPANEVPKEAGTATGTGHTHLSDYQHKWKLLTLTNWTGNPNYQSLSGEIDCATEFGNDYVVLGGGFSISGMNSKVLTNGPVTSTLYKVEMMGPASGAMYATCARIEPTLHQFSLDY